MGVWSKLFRTEEQAPALRSTPPLNEEPQPPELSRLLRLGLSDGPSTEDALRDFRTMRGSVHEGRAVHELIRIAAVRPLPETLVLAIASALVDRGEESSALAMLGTTTSPASLLLRADLQAGRGDVATALATCERVLAREIDHPGARERRQRWRESLGFRAPRDRQSTTSTVALADPDTAYGLLREVARGGSGAVYEAEDRELGRRVALKVYHEPLRDRAQLEHEARVAVRLAGQGVIRVFDTDPEHGWVALEWVALSSLRERLRARDHAHLFPVRRWALPLALALARVHDAGWVHLDVKPANVLLASAGEPLLTDFGIARRSGEASPAGSMGYVSPERIGGRVADPMDDVYGYGRILEDVLDAGTEDDSRWRDLSRACMNPESSRPAHARELVMRARLLET